MPFCRNISATSLFLILIYLCIDARGETPGCTDPKANNYNAIATQNDGSCTYNGANFSPISSILLDSALTETSGLIQWNNYLWSHNDDSNTKLYTLDTGTAAIQQSYMLTDVINKDWEEISQDNNYIYIGDFGNNSSGNRTDLHILRIEKNSLVTNAAIIDTIWFSYDDQTNFNPAAANQTDFDCEAFLVSTDSIYLFTKQWISNKTSIYVLPKQPGRYNAINRGTLNIQGLATGITYLEDKRLAVICGYSNLLQPFLYLLYDFKNYDFLLGNKRRIDVNLPFHQTEGIATQNGLKYYVSNEYFSKSGITTPQKLHTFDLSNLLSNYINGLVLNNTESLKKKIKKFYPNPSKDFIYIESNSNLSAALLIIRNTNGKEILRQNLSKEVSEISIKHLNPGYYIASIEGTAESFSFIKE